VTAAAAGRPVVVGVDGTAASRSALRRAYLEAVCYGVELRVVRAISARASTGQTGTASQALDADVRDCLGPPPYRTAVTQLVSLGPAHRLLLAESRFASLLVLGVGDHRLRERLGVSTGPTCYRHAYCPTLEVPADPIDQAARVFAVDPPRAPVETGPKHTRRQA
jgi:hypothetical protein